ASKPVQRKAPKLASGWNEREALHASGCLTSTPKPRAEGSSPSAPAKKPAVFFENGGFSALFGRVDFERTAGDAQMMLKSSYPLPTILPHSVRYSIKKESKFWPL
ncbi:MAG: hypothetical protein J6J87_08555, partial [Oscillospiraceae bacterium]|nr:hypothetical protein [Oscillospiraceae bacterium]